MANGNILDEILGYGMSVKASDIHLESVNGGAVVKYRVYGILMKEKTISLDYARIVRIQTKMLAGCEMCIQNQSQEGRFHYRLKERVIDLRISILPTPYGENIVYRVLSPEILNPQLWDEDYIEMRNKIWKHLSVGRHGLVLVSGPTGSGKTTTVYRLLKEFDYERTKIMSIEDPVEYEVEGVVQVNVQNQIGYSFSEGIRGFMRHDPDIIMVGEIRDSLTAHYAIQAALTGHLVFSTLHASDIESVPFRLIDLGVEPFLVAEALYLVIAQRLQSVVCMEDNCDGVCESCGGIGYVGQRLMWKYLFADDKFRNNVIRKERWGEGMKTEKLVLGGV